MGLVNPYEWRVLQERPGKRILGKVDLATDELVICEEFLDDWALEQAAYQREVPPLVSPDLKPLAVMPGSVMSRAINEGWIHDQKALKRWANDADNRKLKLTDGTA